MSSWLAVLALVLVRQGLELLFPLPQTPGCLFQLGLRLMLPVKALGHCLSQTLQGGLGLRQPSGQ